MRRFTLPGLPLLVSADLVLAVQQSVFEHADTVIRIVSDIYESYVQHLVPELIKEPVQNEIVLLYDLANSSSYEPKNRMEIIEAIQRQLMSMFSTDASVFIETSDNDGCWLRIKNIDAAIRTAFALRHVASRSRSGARLHDVLDQRDESIY